MAQGHRPVPALAQAGGTGLVTGAEDTAKQGQALPALLLLGSDLQLLVLPTDNGSKELPHFFFFSTFCVLFEVCAVTGSLKFKWNK